MTACNVGPHDNDQTTGQVVVPPKPPCTRKTDRHPRCLEPVGNVRIAAHDVVEMRSLWTLFMIFKHNAHQLHQIARIHARRTNAHLKRYQIPTKHLC